MKAKVSRQKRKRKSKAGSKGRMQQKQRQQQVVNVSAGMGGGGGGGYQMPIYLPQSMMPQSLDYRIAEWEARRMGLNPNDRDPERKNIAENAMLKINPNSIPMLESDLSLFQELQGNLQAEASKMPKGLESEDPMKAEVVKAEAIKVEKPVVIKKEEVEKRKVGRPAKSNINQAFMA